MSYQRLTAHWVYGGFLSAFVITALGLVLLRDASLALILVYLHLPMYQVHQYEEHDGDRFRTWVNDVMGGGRDLLPATAIFVINIVGVWALFTAVIVGAASYDIGLGLAVVYPTLINAVAHVVPVLVRRAYNPGAATAALLFLPVSGATLWVLSRTPGVDRLDHAIGLAVGVVLHALIVLYVRRRFQRLSD
ncbi:MAG: HXXEE domain-containing protein [Bacteroidota bacterium]